MSGFAEPLGQLYVPGRSVPELTLFRRTHGVPFSPPTRRAYRAPLYIYRGYVAPHTSKSHARTRLREVRESSRHGGVTECEGMMACPGLREAAGRASTGSFRSAFEIYLSTFDTRRCDG